MSNSLLHSVIGATDGRYAVVVLGLPDFDREAAWLCKDGEDGVLVTDKGEWVLQGLMLVSGGGFANSVAQKGTALIFDMATETMLRRSLVVPLSSRKKLHPHAEAIAA